MEENFEERIDTLRQLLKESGDPRPEDCEKYVGIVISAILQHAEDLGGLRCRQILAETLQLPLQRPSYHYSGILRAATKMAALFPEFHYVPFLNLWEPQKNLRKEDFEESKSKDGKTFRPLVEQMVRQLYAAQLLRPEEKPLFEVNDTFGYQPICSMVVTNILHKESNEKHFYFVQLADREGQIIDCEMHQLRANPLTADPNKKSYVNIGQIYDVLLRKSEKGLRVVDAICSSRKVTELFPTAVGYIEHIDEAHGHIHIYDGESRHFVSQGQRFVKASQGQLVEFVPIVPLKSGFKTGIIVNTRHSQADLRAAFPEREITITQLNAKNGYAVWELTDKSRPIQERLSDYQKGEGAPNEAFNSGFVNLDTLQRWMPEVSVGDKGRGIIYLRRGKDGTKRPRLELLRK